MHAAPHDARLCIMPASPELMTDDFLRQWRDLGQNAAEPNPFYESWFLLPAMQKLKGGGQVNLITLWSAEPQQSILLGLMPLSPQFKYGRWPIPNLSNWLHPNAFLGNPLVRKGAETIFWEKLLQHCDQNSGTALFLHLHTLCVGDPLHLALKSLCTAQGRQFEPAQIQQRALLKGPAEPEVYYAAAVRGKKRKELRRQKNRLSEMGDLQFARHDGGVDLALWKEEFLKLGRMGWKGKNGSALDCDPETSTLFKDALHGAAQQGRLELLDLRLDGKPLAMLVNFLCSPGSYSFKTAFDEEYARFSPGVLLQIENLSLLERDGINWCDSCAAQDHPMIDSLWTDRREIGRYSIAIGGGMRRALFAQLSRVEQKKLAAGKDSI